MELGVPLPKTPDGRVYRYSPNERAHPRHFVLGQTVKDVEATLAQKARMKLTPRSNQTVCPYSGAIEEDNAFTHPDDIKAAHKIVEQAVHADVNAALKGIADNFNRGSRGRLFSIRMDVKSHPTTRPRFYRKDLLRELVCDHCGRDYGVYAIGLFCPDCGAPNLALHFAREIELVEKQVIVASSQATIDEELAYRLLGNAHEDVLTAFEATLKTVYLHGKVQGSPEPPPKISNDFQNIERGKKRFTELNLQPFDVLSGEEHHVLSLNIQKRHIIGHNLGIVDEKFAGHANDAKLGQTTKIVGDDILAFAHVAQKVVGALDEWLAAPSDVVTSLPASSTGQELASASVLPSDEAKAREMKLSPLAYRIAIFLAKEAKTGLRDPINDEPLLAAFSDVSDRALSEAVAELETDGYLSTTMLVGVRLPRMRYEAELFATFDPLAIESDPVKDAVVLARALVEQEKDGVSVPEFHVRSGLTLRRFNPALGIVLERIDGPISKTQTADYPTLHFTMIATDRVALRRFVTSLTGDNT